MSTFSTILLIVIFILMISDVFFLWKIYTGIKRRKKYIPDEKYFELKYNINLLKAVSAILIFLIGFLGFNTYNNISQNINKDFTDKLEKQNIRIDGLTTKLFNYEKFVDSLKVEESETVDNLDEINRKFKSINSKLKENEESLKYTTKVYVVENLKIYIEKESQTFFFKDMSTINGERLPKFNKRPMITIQGKSGVFTIVELTREYVKLYIDMYMTDNTFEYFDIWIAEPN